MSVPRRIQRSRAKGWRTPPNTVYVGRPTEWGNPFDWRDWRAEWPFDRPSPCPWTDEIDRDAWARAAATQEFKDAIKSGELSLDVGALKGKNLACWCRLADWCHADVLLEIANAPLKCEAA